MNATHQTIALSMAAGIAAFSYCLLVSSPDGTAVTLRPLECALVVAAAVYLPGAAYALAVKIGRWVAMGGFKDPGQGQA